MKLKLLLSSLIALVCALLIACNPQSRGFALPQGDIENGKEVFTELGCNHCHSAGDIEWIGYSDDIRVPLGGQVESDKTYGELVTSIINPSHEIAPQYRKSMTTETGASKMRIYNEVMTVQNLVDIVTFLQEEYDVVPPQTPYHVY